MTTVGRGLRASEHGQTLLAGFRVRVHQLPSNWPWFTSSHKASSHGSAVEQQLGTSPQHTCLWSPVGTPDMAARVGDCPLPVPNSETALQVGSRQCKSQAFLILDIFFPHHPFPCSHQRRASARARPFGDGTCFKEENAVAVFSFVKRKTIPRCLLPSRPQAVDGPILAIPWALHANLRFVKKYLDS